MFKKRFDLVGRCLYAHTSGFSMSIFLFGISKMSKVPLFKIRFTNKIGKTRSNWRYRNYSSNSQYLFKNIFLKILGRCLCVHISDFSFSTFSIFQTSRITKNPPFQIGNIKIRPTLLMSGSVTHFGFFWISQMMRYEK